MSELAAIFQGVGCDGSASQWMISMSLELEALHLGELLAEALREEKQLQMCGQHPSVVWFDERHCPACRMITEYSQRTLYPQSHRLTKKGGRK